MGFPYRWRVHRLVISSPEMFEEYLARYQADGWEIFNILPYDSSVSFMLILRTQADAELVEEVNRDHSRNTDRAPRPATISAAKTNSIVGPKAIPFQKKATYGKKKAH